MDNVQYVLTGKKETSVTSTAVAYNVGVNQANGKHVVMCFSVLDRGLQTSAPIFAPAAAWQSKKDNLLRKRY